MKQMPSESIGSVINLLELSTSDFVQTAYNILLGRWPQSPELSARVSALRMGAGRSRMLADIAASSEFKARQQALVHEGDDEAFLERVYTAYIGRIPEPDGMEFYLNLLRSGKARERVQRDIATSKEARIAGAFWYEFDRLVASERTNIRGLRYWLGRTRRLERRINREFEVLNRAHGRRIADARWDETSGRDNFVSLLRGVDHETLLEIEDIVRAKLAQYANETPDMKTGGSTSGSNEQRASLRIRGMIPSDARHRETE
jgi:hypothetical protein